MTEIKKKLLKKSLSIAIICLAVLWIGLFFYGVLAEVKITAKREEGLAQMVSVDITTPSAVVVRSNENIKKKVEDDELSQQISNITNTVKETDKSEEQVHKDKAKLSIIVTNLGTNKSLTQQALSLPKNITLGFSPYTTALREYYQQAIKSGFDVLIYMPFEPVDYPMSDPGPYAILEENLPQKNVSIIRNMITAFAGAKGIYGNYKEALSINEKAFAPIIELITQKNMYILLGRNFSNDPSKYLQNYKNIVEGDVVIDMVPDGSAIKHSLNNLLALAKSKKTAVGYINTYPITLTVLSEWLASFNDKDVEIVPISSLIGE